MEPSDDEPMAQLAVVLLSRRRLLLAMCGGIARSGGCWPCVPWGLPFDEYNCGSIVGYPCILQRLWQLIFLETTIVSSMPGHGLPFLAAAGLWFGGSRLGIVEIPADLPPA